MAQSKRQNPELLRAERLKRLREYHGFTSQRTWAAHLGILYTRWNNYERGWPLRPEIEDQLVRITPGLTVDWLRNGERRGLPVELDRRLHDPQSEKGRFRAS